MTMRQILWVEVQDNTIHRVQLGGEITHRLVHERINHDDGWIANDNDGSYDFYKIFIGALMVNQCFSGNIRAEKYNYMTEDDLPCYGTGKYVGYKLDALPKAMKRRIIAFGKKGRRDHKNAGFMAEHERFVDSYEEGK